MIKMKNKFKRFLMSLSGIFLVGIFVSGIKIQEDKKEIKKVKDNLKNSALSSDIVENQKRVALERERQLQKIASSPKLEVSETITKTTIIPGETIVKKETVEVSDKETKTS